MSPSLARRLRARRTTIGMIASLSLAAGVALLVHRRERALDREPTACAHVVGHAFEREASSAPDSVLLARLLEYRRGCTGDAVYVDQTRRLLLAVGRVADARAILDTAERAHAFVPAELAAQRAWVDLAEAQVAWSNGAQRRSDELRDRAINTANGLRAAWPEWQLPYLLLEEADRTGGKSRAPGGIDRERQERSARGRVITGAVVRDLEVAQAVIAAFGLTLVAALGLWAAAEALLALREMRDTVTSSVGAALPGYVELVGTLHLPPNAAPVIGPQSREPGVWYEVSRASGAKGVGPSFERSVQPFVIRDPTGVATVDPRGMTVRTRHSVTSHGMGGGVSSGRRVSERMLREGDEAYVLGELTITGNNASERHVAVAANGRRLLVSNRDERQLMRRERVWLALGATAFVVALSLLAWGFWQRYAVAGAPT